MTLKIFLFSELCLFVHACLCGCMHIFFQFVLYVCKREKYRDFVRERGREKHKLWKNKKITLNLLQIKDLNMSIAKDVAC